MFEKVIIATDLGESSEQFGYCKQGLRNLGVKQVLLGVCIRMHSSHPNLSESIDALFGAEFQKRKKTLEKLGYAVEFEKLLGDPAVEVNEKAVRAGCSLVVVDSRVNSLAGEVFMGGTAAVLLHHSRLPLLILRQPVEPDCSGKCPLDMISKVLFATDFSVHAEHAFRTLEGLVGQGLKSIVLMHVQDRGKIDKHLIEKLEEFNRIDQSRLERMKDALTSAGAENVQIELSYGCPKQDIVHRAKQDDISLVLMGSQGRGFVGEMFLGSVSHSVARRAQVPVLLISMAE